MFIFLLLKILGQGETSGLLPKALQREEYEPCAKHESQTIEWKYPKTRRGSNINNKKKNVALEGEIKEQRLQGWRGRRGEGWESDGQMVTERTPQFLCVGSFPLHCT